VCFFFSSRRRHTRFSRDWSSDVCSSDLAGSLGHGIGGPERGLRDLADRAEVQLVDLDGGVVLAERELALVLLVEGAHGPLERAEIGRASCRERVEISVGADA